MEPSAVVGAWIVRHKVADGFVAVQRCEWALLVLKRRLLCGTSRTAESLETHGAPGTGVSCRSLGANPSIRYFSRWETWCTKDSRHYWKT